MWPSSSDQSSSIRPPNQPISDDYLTSLEKELSDEPVISRNWQIAGSVLFLLLFFGVLLAYYLLRREAVRRIEYCHPCASPIPNCEDIHPGIVASSPSYFPIITHKCTPSTDTSTRIDTSSSDPSKRGYQRSPSAPSIAASSLSSVYTLPSVSSVLSSNTSSSPSDDHPFRAEDSDEEEPIPTVVRRASGIATHTLPYTVSSRPRLSTADDHE